MRSALAHYMRRTAIQMIELSISIQRAADRLYRRADLVEQDDNI